MKWIFAYDEEYESCVKEFGTYEEAKKEYDHWVEYRRKEGLNMSLYLCEIKELSR
jgi:hypothetical protein